MIFSLPLCFPFPPFFLSRHAYKEKNVKLTIAECFKVVSRAREEGMQTCVLFSPLHLLLPLSFPFSFPSICTRTQTEDESKLFMLHERHKLKLIFRLHFLLLFLYAFFSSFCLVTHASKSFELSITWMKWSFLRHKKARMQTQILLLFTLLVSCFLLFLFHFLYPDFLPRMQKQKCRVNQSYFTGQEDKVAHCNLFSLLYAFFSFSSSSSGMQNWEH